MGTLSTSPLFTAAAIFAILALGQPLHGAPGAPRPDSRRTLPDSIVYAARYYTPRVRAQSHFHLYRIRADGSGRRQLTFGNGDEYDPAVSPDGSRIAFRRKDSEYLLDTRSGGTMLLPSIFGQSEKDTGDQTVDHVRWSPDGQSFVVFTDAGDTSDAVVCDGKTGRIIGHWEGLWDIVPAPDGQHSLALTEETAAVYSGFKGSGRAVLSFPGLVQGCWLDSQTVVLFDPAAVALVVVPLHGPRRTVPLKSPASESDLRNSLTSDSTKLLRIPGSAKHVFLWVVLSNSTVGAYGDYYVVDLASGAMTDSASGMTTLTLAEDGRSFVATRTRSLSPLTASGHGASERDVWTAPVQVGDIVTGHTRSVVDGLVWATSATWNGSSR